MNQTRWFGPWKTAGGSILFISQPELVLFAARVRPGAVALPQGPASSGGPAWHGLATALRTAASDPALRTAVS